MTKFLLFTVFFMFFLFLDSFFRHDIRTATPQLHDKTPQLRPCGRRPPHRGWDGGTPDWRRRRRKALRSGASNPRPARRWPRIDGRGPSPRRTDRRTDYRRTTPSRVGWSGRGPSTQGPEVSVREETFRWKIWGNSMLKVC